ncbi:MAG: hypothetical protein KGV51_02415 [Moraxellaceae bacterium]|nr:hypothetical protein [Moraxellaceae bacterium]
MLNTHSSRLRVIFLSIFSTSLLLNPALAETSSVQLFNSIDNPSTSKIAKNDLLNALKQHLANEHISVSEGKYQVRSFIKQGSIDEGSRSLLQTVLDVGSYKEQKEKEKKEELIKGFVKTIKQEIADGELEKMSDEDIENYAETRYNNYIEEDSTSQKAKKSLGAYFLMKEEEKANKQQKTEAPELNKDFVKKFIKDDSWNELFKIFQLTPEQVEAMDYYRMQPLSFNMLGQNLPKQRKYQSVISYDFASPTSQLSLQIPLAMDFNKGSVTLDPSAVMPILAIADENKDIGIIDKFQQQKTHTITFSLPKEIREQIPTDVIYDALIHSVEVAFSEMNEEYFTPVNIRNDKFAKKVHAKQAIKVHWGSKQMGEFMGKAIKSIGKDLQAHIDKNPSKYKHKHTLKKVIESWTSTSQDFQSKDIGGLMQLIEAIAPINLNQTAYYYLNNNKLVAYQAKLSMGSEVYGWTNDMVIQTRYDEKSVKNSPFYPLFAEDFGENAPKSINANEWFADMKTEEGYQLEAKLARVDYDVKSVEADTEPSDEDLETDNKQPSAHYLSADAYQADIISPVRKDDNNLFFNGNFSNDTDSEEYQKTKEAFLQFNNASSNQDY